MKKTIILTLTAILVGCASTDTTNKYCDGARNVVKLYEASLAVRVPTPDEIRAYTAAQAVLIMYCGAPGSVVPVDGTKAIGTIPKPKQPKRITTTASGARVIYYLEVPFSIIQDPSGIYRDYGSQATITVGPLYRTANPSRKQYLWMPDQAWLQGLTKEPTMMPIR